MWTALLAILVAGIVVWIIVSKTTPAQPKRETIMAKMDLEVIRQGSQGAAAVAITQVRCHYRWLVHRDHRNVQKIGKLLNEWI